MRSFNCPEWGRRYVYLALTRAERHRLSNGERADTIPVRTACC